jgi:hypothetical protein
LKPNVNILSSADSIYQQIRKQIDDLSPIAKKEKDKDKNRDISLSQADELNANT